MILRQDAQRRGVALAQQVVFLSDGAAWTEEIQRQNFSEAVSILDFYHAAERVHTLAKVSSPDDAAAKKQAGRWIKDLLKDKVASVIDQARQLTPRNKEKLETAQEQLKFLTTHQDRMRYGT